VRLRALPAVAYLRACFELAADGRLRWRVRPANHFANDAAARSWNSRLAGRWAGCRCRRNHKVAIKSLSYPRARIVAALAFGRVPGVHNEVLHLDGNPHNDAPHNLALVKRAAIQRFGWKSRRRRALEART
jgi:hypothetical protein